MAPVRALVGAVGTRNKVGLFQT
eukprot:SAG31_NODE_50959_length_105_cov_14.166667_1_plen_22_part_10